MKKVFYSITTILLSAAVLTLSSCLKDPRYVDFSKVGTLVELPLAAANGLANLTPQAFTISNTPSTLPLIVNVASPSPLTTALSVTLAIDQADLTAYNTANSTNYQLLPAADYSVASWTVTVPANQREATLSITINSSLIDPSGQYVLPIKIVSASGQPISNYSFILFNVQAKNKYDGQYTVTGTMVDNVNAALTGSYPRTVDLITQNATAVGYYDTGIGYGHAILNNGSASYYGSFAPVFNFDPTSNKIIAVTNYYGQPAANTRSARIDASGINALSGTPGQAGSVIQVKYVMVQASAGGDRTFFNETLTYIGSR